MYNNNIIKKGKSQEITNSVWRKYSDDVSSPTIKKVTYYKWLNQKLIKVLNLIGENEKAKLMYECGTFIQLGLKNGHEIITKSNFCRQRLCNVCAWRKSKKFVGQMFPVMDYIIGQGYQFIFITLTIKNPEEGNVKNTINLLLSAWDKLCKRRKYKRVFKGFCRSVEITYNKKQNTYHPHIHALIAVEPSYFSGNDYITTEELSTDWGQCLGIDYNPHCSIMKVGKRKTATTETRGAVVETIKYAYKIMQCDINISTVTTLLKALENKRLISFGGCIAEARRQLKQEDIENISLNDDVTDKNTYDVLYLFSPAGWKIYEERKINNETND